MAPICILHWIILLVLLVFLDHAAFDLAFGTTWLELQLAFLAGDGGFSGAGALKVFSNATLTNPTSISELVGLTTAVELSSGGTVAYSPLISDVSVASLSRMLVGAPEPDFDAAHKFLTPRAAALVSEWKDLRSRLSGCFSAGTLYLSSPCVHKIITRDASARAFTRRFRLRNILLCPRMFFIVHPADDLPSSQVVRQVVPHESHLAVIAHLCAHCVVIGRQRRLPQRPVTGQTWLLPSAHSHCCGPPAPARVPHGHRRGCGSSRLRLSEPGVRDQVQGILCRAVHHFCDHSHGPTRVVAMSLLHHIFSRVPVRSLEGSRGPPDRPPPSRCPCGPDL